MGMIAGSRRTANDWRRNMNLKTESSDLDQIYLELLKAQKEFAGMKLGENLSTQSYEVISRLITLSLMEINFKRLQNPGDSR